LRSKGSLKCLNGRPNLMFQVVKNPDTIFFQVFLSVTNFNFDGHCSIW
jgi:hypothetical protein